MNFNLKLPLSNTLTFLIVPYAHHEPRGVTPGALVRCMPTPSPHISRQRFDVLTGVQVWDHVDVRVAIGRHRQQCMLVCL